MNKEYNEDYPRKTEKRNTDNYDNLYYREYIVEQKHSIPDYNENSIAGWKHWIGS